MPAGALYFGGTDPGRFVMTALQHTLPEHAYTLLTQNALADVRYVDYLRATLPSAVTLFSQQDCEDAFKSYYQKIQDRIKQGGHIEDVSMENGKISLKGFSHVMEVNSLLAEQIWRKNPDRDIYVEESYPMPWMYPCLAPAGMLMQLRHEPVQLTDDVIQRDTAYWNALSQTLLSNPRYSRDGNAQKTFAKNRTAIAGVYEYHQRWDAAERAYRQSLQLCPSSMEPALRLASMYLKLNRAGEALALAQDFRRSNPALGDRINSMIEAIKATQGAQRQ